MPLSAGLLNSIARTGCQLSVDAHQIGPTGLRATLTAWAREGGSLTIRYAGVISDAMIRDIARDFGSRVRFEF